ncbi:hypothetical protein DID80_04675 [Candidatus Marinamargulisbacteria bacterium SCGC AAA071-K20]|nr:hypothetical protein DID80_04675 [Candidatus Marinamargulisbacteria bacterium SCGC AAA071-K20]
MIEQDIRIESKSGLEVSQHPYYKKLSSELKAKRAVETNDRLKEAQKQQEAKVEEQHYEDKVDLTKNRTESEDTQLRQSVKTNAESWGKNFDELADNLPKNQEQMSDQAKEFITKLKTDGKKIIDYFGHKINFLKRLPDLKEMFKMNLLQSKSHNMFVAKFADFKVGVVGQILSYIGVPIEELKKLRQEALNEAFEENLELMSQNLYNVELSELVHGRSRKVISSLKMYKTNQAQLIKNMENLGRKGFWNKSRLFEEKLKQLSKIEDELKDEMNHLIYQRDYLAQVEE